MSAEEKLYEKLAEGIIKELFSRIDTGASWLRKKWSEAEEDFSILIGQAFKYYYKGALPKYTRTKTMLFRAQPVSVKDYVEPPDLVVKNWKGETQKRLTGASVEKLLEASKRAVISGMAGSGKSTLLRYFFLQSLEKKVCLPIFFELRRLNGDEHPKLLDGIWEEFQSYGCSIGREAFFEIISAGKFCIFLDGFDELESKIVEQIERQINELGYKFRECPIVVTSRPRSDGFTRLQEYTEFSISPLSLSQAKALVNKLNVDLETSDLFLEKLELELFRKYKEFSTNPLLLTLMFITFDEYGHVPTQRYLLYEQVVDTLAWRHDRMKQSFKREMLGGLETDKLKSLLEGVAAQTYLLGWSGYKREKMEELISKASLLTSSRESINTFGVLEDLTNAISIFFLDGRRYRFLHRSFEEYFAARFICRQEEQKASILFDKVCDRIMTDEVIPIATQVNQVLMEKVIWERITSILKATCFENYRVSEQESLDHACEEFLEAIFDSTVPNESVRKFSHNDNDDCINENSLAILYFLPSWYRVEYPNTWRLANENLENAIGKDQVSTLDNPRWNPRLYRKTELRDTEADFEEGIPIGKLLSRNEDRSKIFDYFKDLLLGFCFAVRLQEKVHEQGAKRQASEDILFS